MIVGHFTAVWAPVPKDLPAREILAYLCAFISLATGIGLFCRRWAAAAARTIFAALALWVLLFRVRPVWRSPGVEEPWSGCAETAVMVAAAWILYVRFAGDWDRRVFGGVVGGTALRLARGLYGLALLPFGLAHFVYLKETVELVPGWLPAHPVWAYFTGCAFIAAGLAILSGIGARLAAALSAVQLGSFTLLVWVPIVAAGAKEPYQWSETVLSWALTAGAWVVAESYCLAPRLGGVSPSTR